MSYLIFKNVYTFIGSFRDVYSFLCEIFEFLLFFESITLANHSVYYQ